VGEAGSTPVERSAFMTDWKDYRVSPLHRTHTISHSKPNFSNPRGISIRHVALSPVGDVASPPAVPGGFSCHHCTAVKVTGARKHTRLCDGLCTSLHCLQSSWLTAGAIILPLLHGEDIRVNRY